MDEKDLQDTMLIIAEKISAPFIPWSGPSEAAAQAVAQWTNTRRVRIWASIYGRGSEGSIASELEREFGGRSTVSVRMLELQDLGALESEGKKRPTRPGSKHLSTIWKARAIPPALVLQIQEAGGAMSWCLLCQGRRRREKMRAGYTHILVGGMGEDKEEIEEVMAELVEWKKEKLFVGCLDTPAGRISSEWLFRNRISTALFSDDAKLRDKAFRLIDPDSTVIFSGDENLKKLAHKRGSEVYEY